MLILVGLVYVSMIRPLSSVLDHIGHFPILQPEFKKIETHLCIRNRLYGKANRIFSPFSMSLRSAADGTSNEDVFECVRQPFLKLWNKSLPAKASNVVNVCINTYWWHVTQTHNSTPNFLRLIMFESLLRWFLLNAKTKYYLFYLIRRKQKLINWYSN